MAALAMMLGRKEFSISRRRLRKALSFSVYAELKCTFLGCRAVINHVVRFDLRDRGKAQVTLALPSPQSHMTPIATHTTSKLMESAPSLLRPNYIS